MANFVIDSIHKLKEKMNMIDSLSEFEIATKTIIECEEGDDEIDILNSHFKKLNCDIKSLEKNVRIY